MNRITEPGFYPDMPEAIYRADPCPTPALSNSVIKVLVSGSPLHAWASHPRLGKRQEEEKEQTKATLFGELVHKLVLGRGRDIAVSPYDSFRTNEAKEWKRLQAQQGKIIAKQEWIDEAGEVVKSVRKSLADLDLSHVFSDGPTEVVAIWKSGEVWCKAMMDFPHWPTATIWDLKTCDSANPRALKSKVPNFGYDSQAVFYRRGAGILKPELLGRIKFRFVFVETSYPYAVTVAELDNEVEAIAESKVCRAIATWKNCLALDRWPAYSSEVVKIESQPWALTQEFG